MKIDKNTANAYACYEKYSKYCNTVYIVQELHTFLKSFNRITFKGITFKVSL